jgi:long-chain acyl-CoA synthetase
MWRRRRPRASAYTNVEQQRAANRLAHALTRLGVAEGDRVVVMLPNCPEVLQACAAILKVGAVIVPSCSC